MQLLEDLERQKAKEESYFRQHLLSEDIGRLKRLAELSNTCEDVEAFIKQGTMIGWTPNNLRTHELASTLKPLMEAIYMRAQSQSEPASTPEQDHRIAQLWHAFDTDRMERLVGCLARVPPPEDN